MMKTTSLGLILAAGAVILSSCGGPKPGQVREIPLEDFFRNPEAVSYQISPSGEYYSYAAPYQDRRNIFIRKVGDDNAQRITSETERDIAGFFWANDERILYIKDTGGDENFQLYGVNIDGSNPIAYTAIPGVRTEILDRLPDIDSMVLIQTNERNPMIFDPYRLNVNTGEMTLLAENPGNIQGWDTDNEGKLRVAYAIVDGVNTQILYRETEQDEFRPVITTSFKESVYFYRFLPDNKYVYAGSNLGRDKVALVIIDPATGEEIEQLYDNDRYDIGGISYSRVRDELDLVAYMGHKESVRHYFTDYARDLYAKIEKNLKTSNFSVSSRSRDEQKMIIGTGSDRSYGTYWFYNADTDEFSKIADVAPWIKEEEMAQMLPVNYTSRDGLDIEGFLTLPVGYTMKNAKNLPVVVNPHGGPWARDYWGFNPEIQFLANRGYAVFQMNFRGSTGRGREFTELSYKQWGQTMQDDVTDGTQWLIDQGIADPERIAIYGGSYGGYATLQGLVKEPELYACGIDYVGVSNLFTFLETIPPYWKPMLDMMYEMVGDPVKDSLMLAQNSPALNAHRIVRPLFVAQGANDPRVNKDESDQMVDALKARGVEVDYMVKWNEGHGFHNQENQFEFYRAMERFLGEHLLGNTYDDREQIVPDPVTQEITNAVQSQQMVTP